MMALKMTVITCQLNVIDNNNSSEWADEVGTDMSRVLQTCLMGRHIDSSDLMDQGLPSTCLFSLSLLTYSLHPLPSVFYSSFCLHILFLQLAAQRESPLSLPYLIGALILLIFSLSFSLSLSERQVSDSSHCVSALDCLCPSLSFHTIC